MQDASLAEKATDILYLLLLVYLITFAAVWFSTDHLLNFVNLSDALRLPTSIYIRTESFSFIFTIVLQLLIALLIILNNYKTLLLLSALKITSIIIFDIILLTNFSPDPNAIAYSNITVSIVLILTVLLALHKSGLHILYFRKPNFSYYKKISCTSLISGLESLIRNTCYFFMVLSMLNSIHAQASFWMAIAFLWGWLLFPITQLGEVIKRDASLKKLRLGYYFWITSAVIFLWFLCMPFYGYFFKHVIHVKDIAVIMKIISISLPFYAVFAYGNIFSSIFYGLGKPQFILYQTLAVNLSLYLPVFLLYKAGIYTPSLINITLLFSVSMLLGALFNMWIFYAKRKILISPEEA